MRVVAALRPVGRVRGDHLRDRRPPRSRRLVPGEAPGHVPLGQARRNLTGADGRPTPHRPRDRAPGALPAPRAARRRGRARRPGPDVRTASPRPRREPRAPRDRGRPSWRGWRDRRTGRRSRSLVRVERALGAPDGARRPRPDRAGPDRLGLRGLGAPVRPPTGGDRRGQPTAVTRCSGTRAGIRGRPWAWLRSPAEAQSEIEVEVTVRS